MNVANFEKVLNHIKANPQVWYQRDWHCGSSHCFAGWCQLLAGKEQTPDLVEALYSFGDGPTFRDAVEFLQIDDLDARYLFSSLRTIPEFEEFLRNAYAGELRG